MLIFKASAVSGPDHLAAFKHAIPTSSNSLAKPQPFDSLLPVDPVLALAPPHPLPLLPLCLTGQVAPWAFYNHLGDARQNQARVLPLSI